MQLCNLPQEIFMKTHRQRLAGKTIGLVPTMGALHEGHFHLIKQARQENDLLVVSIFVNPLQFDNQEDFDQYPRMLTTDLEHLDIMGVDMVFAPSEKDMYPEEPQMSLCFGRMEEVMEGACRPGHFAGVGIVVTKLFQLCQPHKAYFGKKDLQQYLIVRRMVMDLSMPVQVVGVPIVREPSGLAMSSRNQRLSSAGRQRASAIYRGLSLAKELWDNGNSPEETKSKVRAFYEAQAGLTLEYLSIVSPANLEELEYHENQPAVICVAGFVEDVRLIDNLYLRQD